MDADELKVKMPGAFAGFALCSEGQQNHPFGWDARPSNFVENSMLNKNKFEKV